jgi:hypothetical protein
MAKEKKDAPASNIRYSRPQPSHYAAWATKQALFDNINSVE